tara:strand:- start:688 stop:1005 length:318 start_codon:yes stop_codon:yes gene_type:complete
MLMINRKIIFGLFMLSLTGACSAPSAMIGPVYTLTSTGNIYQTGFSYGSNQLITSFTGKTPIENLKEISVKKDNIKKQTLQSDDFYQLVKNKIEKTGKILNLSNQ